MEKKNYFVKKYYFDFYLSGELCRHLNFAWIFHRPKRHTESNDVVRLAKVINRDVFSLIHFWICLAVQPMPTYPPRPAEATLAFKK